MKPKKANRAESIVNHRRFCLNVFTAVILAIAGVWYFVGLDCRGEIEWRSSAGAGNTPATTQDAESPAH